MRLPLPADFFAPVRLSPTEARDLQQVETRLLATYLASYDADAPDAAWKFVGQRAGVKIFSQRPAKKKKRPSRRRTDERELPALRLVGSVDGTLEDVLYGSMWRSGRERAARAHFTGDGVADGAVLCSVETPSSAEPFRSLSVKWALKRAPHGGLVVKDRDFCYLAASGVVHSPRTGAKLGYKLRHSVTFPSCPAFQNHSVVRGQIFLCSLFRQLPNGRVEVFHEGTYDAGGGHGTIGLGLPKSIAEKSIVETLLSLEDARACALAKKLARAVENTEAERAVASLSSTSVQESLDGERRCGMCLRRLGSALKRRCAACCHWTCSQCSVRQETVPSARDTWTKGPVLARCFCKACVAKVLREDATKYAARDANADDYEITSGRWGHDDIPEEDEGEEEEVHLPNRRHSMVAFAADTREVEELSRQRRLMTVATGVPSSTEFGSRTSASRLSVKQLSVDSDAMNTVNSSPPDNRRRRSATLSTVPARSIQTQKRSRPRRRPSMNAPDILLRSDVGKRNWASSTSALSLQSPQRHIDGSPIVNLNRNHHRQRSGSMSPSVHRLSFGSNCSSGGRSDKEVRVRIITPRRSQPVAAYTPYFASAGLTPRKASPDPGPPSIRTVHHQFFRDLYSNQNVSRR